MNYDDLLLKEEDKIQKTSLFDRFFQKEPKLTEENLDFLDKQAQPHTQHTQEAEDNKEVETINTSLTQEEKDSLLDTKENTVAFSSQTILIALSAMIIALVLFIPKIYIRNNIYYTSRNIIQLQTQLDSLNEENKHIKKQLEDIKFNNLTYELDFSSR
ncbi:hypothetical protein [Helicobacter ibis]|uniref:Septum formation initiator n=1 Tax=Helicobacter ibis TaxID=2962633 RepID=A0ABT4VEE0_9HELI|nr:hypothetical protein [Helicobacter ibis]MDA3969059.1 hypothetical protein [Helicobacter ibis]